MNSSNDHNDEGNNSAYGTPGNTEKSIVSGIGYGCGGFIMGTILAAILIFLFWGVIYGSCGDTCGLLMIYVSPIGGGVLAIVAGIRGGKQTYKRLSENK